MAIMSLMTAHGSVLWQTLVQFPQVMQVDRSASPPIMISIGSIPPFSMEGQALLHLAHPMHLTRSLSISSVKSMLSPNQSGCIMAPGTPVFTT